MIGVKRIACSAGGSTSTNSIQNPRYVQIGVGEDEKTSQDRDDWWRSL